MARQGDFKKAQVISKAWDNKMQKNTAMTSVAQQNQMQDFRSNIQQSYGMMYEQSQIQP